MLTTLGDTGSNRENHLIWLTTRINSKVPADVIKYLYPFTWQALCRFSQNISSFAEDATQNDSFRRGKLHIDFLNLHLAVSQFIVIFIKLIDVLNYLHVYFRILNKVFI